VADKAISVSNIINGATRLQPCVLLTGQAAGVVAALSVKNNVQVRDINIHQVQQTLLDAKAYLMPLIDVNPTDKEFQSIQRVTVSGILKVKGESFQWANRSWFYPDTTITVKVLSEGLKTFDDKSALENDESVLTLKKASDLFSKYLKRDVAIDIEKIWGRRMNRKFDKNLTLTKREISVLADELIRPFETKEIGFDGNYREK
jgi:predicted amino acid-binding ACT domain protein